MEKNYELAVEDAKLSPFLTKYALKHINTLYFLHFLILGQKNISLFVTPEGIEYLKSVYKDSGYSLSQFCEYEKQYCKKGKSFSFTQPWKICDKKFQKEFLKPITPFFQDAPLYSKAELQLIELAKNFFKIHEIVETHIWVVEVYGEWLLSGKDDKVVKIPIASAPQKIYNRHRIWIGECIKNNQHISFDEIVAAMKTKGYILTLGVIDKAS